MPSEVPPVTLTIGGNDCQDLEGIFLQLDRGGPGEQPSYRGRDDIAPRLVGRVRRNRVADARRVTLFGFVRGSGADEDAQRGDYWDNRLTLEGWITHSAETELAATLPNGGMYTLNVRGINDGAIIYNEVVPSFAWVSVELESIDPEWEEAAS